MKHLILTGFMGSGKSTIGKIAASILKIPFVDLDQVIATQTGLTPAQTITRFGEKAFRRIEKRFLKKILSGKVSVLATGGGVVLDRQNRQWMRQKGFVVWLKTPLLFLLKRLNRGKDRPLLTKPLTRKALKKIDQERLPFYRQCHYSVSNAFRPSKDVAIQIAEKYKGRIACTRNW